MSWIKAKLARSWRWIVVALSVVAAALGVAAAQRRSREERLEAADQLAVGKAMAEVARLREERFQALGRVEVRAAEIDALDDEIVASQRDVVAAHQTTEEMNDVQVLQEFHRLGYR